MQKYLWMNYLIACSGCLNMIYNGYDGSLYSSFQVMDSWLSHFNHPSAYWIGMINTIPGIVGIVYSFFAAPLVNDWLGRKRSIFVAAVFNVIAAVIMAISPNLACFIIARVLITISVSQGSNSGPLLVSELAHPKIRGQLISFWQMFWSFGALEAAGICLGTSYYPNLGTWQWRIPSLLQVFTPAMICACMTLCPESPRWLAANNRIDEARKALKQVRSEEEVETELREIEAAVLYEREVTKGRYKQWFVNKSYLRRLAVAFFLYLGQQLGGMGVLTQYSGIIYNEVFKNSSTDILLNFLNWTLAVLYVLPATFYVDKVGRKPLLLIGAVGQALAMFLVATVVTQTPKEANGDYKYSIGIASVLFVFLYNLFYQFSWGCSTWVIATEIFPLNVRAQGLAISGNVEGAVITCLGLAFPTFLDKCGFFAFYFFMAVNICNFIWVFIFLPETKNLTLEEMDHLFGGEDHGIVGQMLLDQKGADNLEHVENVQETKE
ncbi:general substrate transporter [Lipomyces doorenjongii]|uniref:general substrate transporter n=1 Tax=Lipomyces doorenjongii TaxID=383834 RepID=UPI0034CEA61F